MLVQGSYQGMPLIRLDPRMMARHYGDAVPEVFY
jgi:hypothetical protein